MRFPGRTIVKIETADPGWVACYVLEATNAPFEREIAAWAFVEAKDEEGGHVSRVGLVVDGARVVLADDPRQGAQFRGYVAPDEGVGRGGSADLGYGFGHASSWFG